MATPERSTKGLLEKYPAVVFVGPLLVYLLFTSFEPTLPETVVGAAEAEAADAQAAGAQNADAQAAEDQAVESGGIPSTAYPLIYAAKILCTIGAVAFVLPGYRTVPWRVDRYGILAGLAGGLLWIAACSLRLEATWLPRLGLDWLVASGARPAYNPLVALGENPLAAYAFLAVRLAGLVLVVPLIEELFLRGFVIRWCVAPDWTGVRWGQVNRLAVVMATLVPLAMHPGELVAAALWFSLMTWLYARTASVGNCVLAHALTNLCLGIWVLASGQWFLW